MKQGKNGFLDFLYDMESKLTDENDKILIRQQINEYIENNQLNN
jgi:hypothetical protein